MGGIVVSRRATTGRRPVSHRAVVAVTLIAALFLAMGSGFSPTPLASASAERAALQGDDTPVPESPAPQINPVSPNDDTVVRPDDMADDDAPGDRAPATVSGLPASGIGLTVPADDDVRRWTNLAMLALGINALILVGLAARSLRRRA